MSYSQSPSPLDNSSSEAGKKGVQSPRARLFLPREDLSALLDDFVHAFFVASPPFPKTGSAAQRSAFFEGHEAHFDRLLLFVFNHALLHLRNDLLAENVVMEVFECACRSKAYYRLLSRGDLPELSRWLYQRTASRIRHHQTHQHNAWRGVHQPDLARSPVAFATPETSSPALSAPFSTTRYALVTTQCDDSAAPRVKDYGGTNQGHALLGQDLLRTVDFSPPASPRE